MSYRIFSVWFTNIFMYCFKTLISSNSCRVLDFRGCKPASRTLYFHCCLGLLPFPAVCTHSSHGWGQEHAASVGRSILPFSKRGWEQGSACRSPSMHPTALTASGLCRHTAAAQEMFDGSPASGTDITFTWIYTCTVNKNKRSSDISGMTTHESSRSL